MAINFPLPYTCNHIICDKNRLEKVQLPDFNVHQILSTFECQHLFRIVPGYIAINFNKVVNKRYHISLVSFYGTQANSIAPDETPQSAASHLGLFCLLNETS